MSFLSENLILRGVDRPSLEDGDFEEPPATEVELLDLTTLSAHPIKGLSLPMDEGPASSPLSAALSCRMADRTDTPRPVPWRQPP